MLMSVLSITEAAVHSQFVQTHPEVAPVPVLEDTMATDSAAQVILLNVFDAIGRVSSVTLSV